MLPLFTEKKVIELYNPEVTQLVFYGAGALGKKCLVDFKTKNIDCEVIYFCDRNKSLWGTTIFGVDVISPVDLEKLDRSTGIVITSMYYEEIDSYLCAKGFYNTFRFSTIPHYGKIDTETQKKLHEENAEKIDKVYHSLADQKSRLTYNTYLKVMKTGDASLMNELCEGNQYTPDSLIKLGKDEVIIDGGGNDGDTALLFAKKTNYHYKQIYSFEPDATMFEFLQSSVRNLNHIDCFQLGLFNKKANLPFFKVGLGWSSIHKSGMIIDPDCAVKYECTEINTVTIDEFFADKNKITYIKMDLEGSEKEALEGAIKIIKRDRPKLAISIYHHRVDLWEIPLFIIQNFPFYNIYVRAHTCGLTELVMYAIPKSNE